MGIRAPTLGSGTLGSELTLGCELALGWYKPASAHLPQAPLATRCNWTALTRCSAKTFLTTRSRPAASHAPMRRCQERRGLGDPPSSGGEPLGDRRTSCRRAGSMSSAPACSIPQRWRSAKRCGGEDRPNAQQRCTHPPSGPVRPIPSPRGSSRRTQTNRLVRRAQAKAGRLAGRFGPAPARAGLASGGWLATAARRLQPCESDALGGWTTMGGAH